jgi:glycosyltransferase involved in cell wall biosynthesis
MSGYNPRKKILHIVEDLKIGGLERVIESIVLALDRRKYDVEVWCLARGGAVAEEIRDHGVPVRILGLKSYYNPARIGDLARMLREARVDVIHTHGYFASTFCRLAALTTKVPIIILHIHTTYHQFKARNRRIEKLLSLYTDRVICVSRAVEEFAVEQLGIHPQSISMVYNTAFADATTCPAEKVQQWRSALRLDGSEDVVLSLASLTENKGHAVLLYAMKLLVDMGRNIRCILVGDGPLRGKLEGFAESLGIRDAVVFTGAQIDVTPLLRIAHLFVLASIEREGLSVALIEGAAAGLPLVGSRLGGIPEVIEDQRNGILFAPGNSGELFAALNRLLEDRGLRERMAFQSREIYRARFAPEIFIGKIEAIYDRTLERKAHAV